MHVEDGPIGEQAGGGQAQASTNDTSFGQQGLQGCRRGSTVAARCGRRTLDVLDGAVDRAGRRDVSHVENFNVAFTGFVLLVSQRVHTCVDEVTVDLRGQRAGVVGGAQTGKTGAGVLADFSGPHVARRQEQREVEHVVRVGRAAEANLHCLAVGFVGVDDVQQRGVAFLGREVGHHQDVADAFRGDLQRGRWCSNCATSQTQTANHGSDAQRENIFSHENSS